MSAADLCSEFPASLAVALFSSLMAYFLHGGVYFIILRRLKENESLTWIFAIPSTLSVFYIMVDSFCFGHYLFETDLIIYSFVALFLIIVGWFAIIIEEKFTGNDIDFRILTIIPTPILGIIFAGGWLIFSFGKPVLTYIFDDSQVQKRRGDRRTPDSRRSRSGRRIK